jgi:hypothetical protein
MSASIEALSVALGTAQLGQQFAKALKAAKLQDER